MERFENWQDETPALIVDPERDPLSILQSTRPVVESGELVWINSSAIEELCDQWLTEMTHTPTLLETQWDTHYHFSDQTERTLNWILLLDALNFCFWAEKGQQRWTIEYQGETLNGYWAEAAALKRAVEEGLPLWDARYLSTLSADTLAHIFRGASSIPLFEQRLANAHEVGQVLLAQFDGSFLHAIEQANYNAIKLVSLLQTEFSSFRDTALYRSHPVVFLKRAQICVADIHSAFAQQPWGQFSDFEKLTIFADYKLPQVLRHAHIIEYQAALAQQVDNQILISAGSDAEIEIRAATIWACELLVQAMARRGHTVTAADIDQRLWIMGQQSGQMQPYHRTRTIFY